MTIDVRPVSGKAEMKTFIRLQGEILANDPNWVEPLHFERKEFFSQKNPWFTHGRAQYFLAWRDGKAVGRVSAQVDDLSPKVDGGVCGLFGGLTAVDDQVVVSALLDAAEAWLQAEGAGHMRGPYTLNINHESGVLIDGFDTPPMLLMPHDPQWIGGMIEAWGLAKGRDVLAYRLDCRDGLPQKPKRMWRSPPASVNIRSVNLKKWDEEVAHIARIFNASWVDNWGFVPFTQAEIDTMAKELRPLIDPGLVKFAEMDGEPIAFIAILPDINEIIKPFKGRLFPFNILKLLWALKFGKFRGARVPLMGIMPDIGDGIISRILPLMLIYSPEERVAERGIESLEFSWILEDNKPVRSMIEMIGGKVVKTYRIYEKSLA